jgi:hypothetical protein
MTAQGRRHTREDSGLVLDREGRWLHDGEPVTHPKIVEAFNRGLTREPDGRYLLRFGDDWCVVTVEDAPLQIRTALVEGARVGLELSNGASELLRPETLCLRDGVLYCVSETGRPARFSRSAQFALGSALEERDGGFALRLDGREFLIGA